MHAIHTLCLRCLVVSRLPRALAVSRLALCMFVGHAVFVPEQLPLPCTHRQCGTRAVPARLHSAGNLLSFSNEAEPLRDQECDEDALTRRTKLASPKRT